MNDTMLCPQRADRGSKSPGVPHLLNSFVGRGPGLGGRGGIRGGGWLCIRPAAAAVAAVAAAAVAKCRSLSAKGVAFELDFLVCAASFLPLAICLVKLFMSLCMSLCVSCVAIALMHPFFSSTLFFFTLLLSWFSRECARFSFS